MTLLRIRRAFFAAILSLATVTAPARADFVPLGFLPGGSTSLAFAVSADGTVVVGQAISAMGPEAFRWTATSGIEGIGDLPGGEFSSIAFGASGDGTVIVGQGRSGPALEAFRWTQANG